VSERKESNQRHRSIEEIAADIANEYDAERMSELGHEMEQALDEEDQRKRKAANCALTTLTEPVVMSFITHSLPHTHMVRLFETLFFRTSNSHTLHQSF
jgi:hypothetical protein